MSLMDAEDDGNMTEYKAELSIVLQPWNTLTMNLEAT